MTTFLVGKVEIGSVEMDADAAHHARVRRLSAGDDVAVTDGRGERGFGRIERVTKSALGVAIDRVATVAPPLPIHLLVPVADRDRMLWLAEKATELQVASWNPVMYRRSRSVSPRGDGEAFDRKVLARMVAALEQSGGSWLPEIRPVREPLALTGFDDHGRVFLERDGPSLGRVVSLQAPVSLAVGPEGGYDAEEIAHFEQRGWQRASLGEVTLRFETAAIVAVAVARNGLAPS